MVLQHNIVVYVSCSIRVLCSLMQVILDCCTYQGQILNCLLIPLGHSDIRSSLTT